MNTTSESLKEQILNSVFTPLDHRQKVPIIRRTITVRSSFMGFHCWPDAPEEVSFLRALHRHLFKVECVFDVSHPDRNIEFFLAQARLIGVLANLRQTLTSNAHMSCEMMAEYIFRQFQTTTEYSGITKVTVSEDGENDGTYEEFYQ